MGACVYACSRVCVLACVRAGGRSCVLLGLQLKSSKCASMDESDDVLLNEEADIIISHSPLEMVCFKMFYQNEISTGLCSVILYEHAFYKFEQTIQGDISFLLACYRGTCRLK